MRLQKTQWLKSNPRLTIPVNLGLHFEPVKPAANNEVIIFGVSILALPFALGAFPQRSRVSVLTLEDRFHQLKDQNGKPLMVEYNRGI